MKERPQKLDKKTLSVLTYLVNNMAVPTRGNLTRLCYLCDLTGVEEWGKQITDLEYICGCLGPVAPRLEKYLDDLVRRGVLKVKVRFTSNGTGYEQYVVREAEQVELGLIMQLTAEEQEIVEGVLESVGGLNAQLLTEIVYETKPLQVFGLELGSVHHFKEKLNLGVVV